MCVKLHAFYAQGARTDANTVMGSKINTTFKSTDTSSPFPGYVKGQGSDADH